MTRYHLINGVKVALTAEEEAKRDAFEAAEKEKMAANKYKYEREFKYPNVKEQLDLLWHAIDADADLKIKFSTWYDVIKKVKEEYPKP